MNCKVIHTGSRSAQENMEIDQKFLADIGSLAQPILRFYDWQQPSATYGYFINPYNYLNKEGIEKNGLNLAKRPTGGGIVFHVTDLAFSVLVPATHPRYSTNTLDNYVFVNSLVSQAITQFKKDLSVRLLPQDIKDCNATCHFCMAKPTIYDVMVDGKKVGGAAQRRTKEGFLHQGTISLAMPEENLLRDVLRPEVLEAMKRNTYTLLTGSVGREVLEDARERLRSELKIAFSKI